MDKFITAVIVFLVIFLTTAISRYVLNIYTSEKIVELLTVEAVEKTASTQMLYNKIGDSGILTPITTRKIKIRTVERPDVVITSNKDLILIKGDKIKVMFYVKDNNIIGSEVL